MVECGDVGLVYTRYNELNCTGSGEIIDWGECHSLDGQTNGIFVLSDEFASIKLCPPRSSTTTTLGVEAVIELGKSTNFSFDKSIYFQSFPN